MITTSNSLLRRSGIPIHQRGVLVHALPDFEAHLHNRANLLCFHCITLASGRTRPWLLSPDGPLCTAIADTPNEVNSPPTYGWPVPHLGALLKRTCPLGSREFRIQLHLLGSEWDLEE